MRASVALRRVGYATHQALPLAEDRDAGVLARARTQVQIADFIIGAIRAREHGADHFGDLYFHDDRPVAPEPKKPDYEVAWRELHDALQWMQGHKALNRYLGWNFAKIANDLIDRAYPGLRESAALSPPALRMVPQTWIDRAMQIEAAADGLVSMVNDAIQRAEEGTGRLYAANRVQLDKWVTETLEAIAIPEPVFPRAATPVALDAVTVEPVTVEQAREKAEVHFSPDGFGSLGIEGYVRALRDFGLIATDPRQHAGEA